MSDACFNTVENVLGVEIPKEKLCRIYPLVPLNQSVTYDTLKLKSKEPSLRLLYIAQGIRFKSKGGGEIIEAFHELKAKLNISLTIITNIDQLKPREKDRILGLGIHLIDFRLTYNELEKVYTEHHILLQPSSDDSFGLTVLEAMKSGMTIIASRMYAFKEMVENEKNGFLVDPAYYFFTQNDLPNPVVWNRRGKTIYSGKIDSRLVQDLISSIKILYNDRDKLYEYSKCSLEKASSTFDNETIIEKWKTLIIE